MRLNDSASQSAFMDRESLLQKLGINQEKLDEIGLDQDACLNILYGEQIEQSAGINEDRKDDENKYEELDMMETDEIFEFSPRRRGNKLSRTASVYSGSEWNFYEYSESEEDEPLTNNASKWT